MKDHLPKFLLVGVMIFVTAFLNHRLQGGAVGFGETAQEGAAQVTLSTFNVSSSLNFQLKKESNLTLAPSGEAARSSGNPPSSVLVELAPSKEEEEKKPEVEAAAAGVIDLETGTTYFSFNSSQRWPMASLVKMMTAAVAIGKMKPDQEITVTEEDFESVDEEGLRFKPGERYLVSDVIRVMLGVSSNEAAEVLANNYNRGNFIQEMNRQAEAWGLSHTYFEDPTGISVSNQSTVSDLYKLTQAVYQNYPEVFKITRKPQVSIKEIGSGKTVRFLNNNLLAGRADFLGGKTGYTEEARGNLVSIFSYAKRPIVVIVLGAEDRFLETEKLWQWFQSQH